MSKVHLTMTGVFAGVSICGERADGDEGVHYIYAPIDKPEFREKVCPQCLKAHVDSYTHEELAHLPVDHWVRQMAEKPSDSTQMGLL
jgi:hypothetical protein